MIYRTFAAGFLVSAASINGACGADQARSILNSLDPKSMNELLDLAKKQPGAALTNIAPLSPNIFRFLFIWPASNSMMTYERVGRSFAERFASFAQQMKPLATGFCLPSMTMYFGTAAYGEEEVNVAYRDIEVRYNFGLRVPCAGRYLNIGEVEQSTGPAEAPYGYGLPAAPALPSQLPPNPENGLKPFLNTQPAPPLE